jgi:hypothetical protein
MPHVFGALMRMDVTHHGWELLRASGAAPRARFRHSASAVGAQREKMAVWGGFTIHPLDGEVCAP